VQPLENAPPAVVFTTVVLGGFRGVLADVLWLRAARLQEDGRYFELVQLADWITKLEPRHTEIWAFHAWNMAYNASAMMTDPGDRWRWVHNGIELLRDEGLRYNPGDPLLYRELGWLFQNKIGGQTDADNMYFKRRWADEMEGLFPGGRTAPAAAGAVSESERGLYGGYGMDPAAVRAVDAAYGPLDWRLPETHALYWAVRGRGRAASEGSLACDRMVYQALAALFLQGRLWFDAPSGVYVTGPDLDLLPRILGALDEARKRYGESVMSAYYYFLRDAVAMLSSFGREDLAREMFARLQRDFPGDPALAAGLAALAREEMSESSLRSAPKRRAVAAVEGTCYRGLRRLAAGDGDGAAALDSEARNLWDDYVGNMAPDVRAQWGLPTFDQIRELARRRLAGERSAGVGPVLPSGKEKGT
jgi:hypothetical protein